MMNKYLKKHDDDGQVDWSKRGFEMLNEFQQIMEDGIDLCCRRRLGDVLESRGFVRVIPYERFELSDGEGRVVEVLMDDEALRVVRDGVMYHFPMHYELGSDELCDLWEMIRNAWEAD